MAALKIGVIADDFTGAGDAASFLANAGLRTVLFSGTPAHDDDAADCEAAVVALKTRTQETKSAVADTLAAAAWLKRQGAKQLYVKYCSTFDSKPSGNIGPILDALLEEYDVPYTILCPSLPVNGRTVTNGCLYVNGVPLAESPMRDHPLTPMWASSIAELMRPQSQYPCLSVGRVDAGTTSRLVAFAKGKRHFYIIPDYDRDEDARSIVELFSSLPVLSGGSGLMPELARFHGAKSDGGNAFASRTAGPAVVLSGSCSRTTRGQIEQYLRSGAPALRMDPLELLGGAQTEDELWRFIEEKGDGSLVYSSDTPEAVRTAQTAGREKVAETLERATANLAVKAVQHGFTRIVVAGGETSGAVTKALGFDSFFIGESVAPGVPVMIPRKQPELRLVLKSGNFGQPDFFTRAQNMTRG